jgi:hypothetical protein
LLPDSINKFIKFSKKTNSSIETTSTISIETTSTISIETTSTISIETTSTILIETTSTISIETTSTVSMKTNLFSKLTSVSEQQLACKCPHPVAILTQSKKKLKSFFI